MGKQIRFFMAEWDLAGFVDALRKIGFWSVPRVLPTDAVPERISIADVDLGATSHLYLVPAELAPVEAMYDDAPSEPGKEVLNLRKSPVLEFAVPQQDGTELREGRIFMQTAPSHPLYRHAEAAFRKLSQLVGKWPKTDKYDFRVGPHAARMQREGKARLVHFNIELDLAESKPVHARRG
jgi:hypothetical protein